MNTTKKFDDSDLQFLFNLFILVDNYVENMINLSDVSINKCDAITEIIFSIVSDSLDKEKVINKLMLTKTAEIINKNSYDFMKGRE